MSPLPWDKFTRSKCSVLFPASSLISPCKTFVAYVFRAQFCEFYLVYPPPKSEWSHPTGGPPARASVGLDRPCLEVLELRAVRIMQWALFQG